MMYVIILVKRFIFTVTYLNVESTSSTSLKAIWEIPAKSCATNVEYHVEFQLTNRDQCQQSDNNTVMRTSVSETTITLTRLHPYSTYEIRVIAAGGVKTTSAVTDEAG